MHGRLTKRFDRGAIIRYPRMRRTLPHEIIALVVFLHGQQNRLAKQSANPSGTQRAAVAQVQDTRAQHTPLS